MTYEQAVQHLNKVRPALGKETNMALNVVLDPETPYRIAMKTIEEWNSCARCKDAFCRYRKRKVRVNCPLYKSSAV